MVFVDLTAFSQDTEELNPGGSLWQEPSLPGEEPGHIWEPEPEPQYEDSSQSLIHLETSFCWCHVSCRVSRCDTGSRTHLSLGCSRWGIEPLCPSGGCFARRPSEGWLGSWALCRVPWSLPSVISFGHNCPEGIENSVPTHNGVDHQPPQTPKHPVQKQGDFVLNLFTWLALEKYDVLVVTLKKLNVLG